jgi:hypothetical protein
MIAILGLLLLIVAALLAVTGIASNSGSAHPLGGDFTIAGIHLSGMSSGQLFWYGIVVGGTGVLGLSMLLGTFSRRMASRGSRRALQGSRREAEALRLDQGRLTQQLDDERADHRRAAVLTSTDQVDDQVDQSGPDDRADTATLGERPGLLHRIGHRSGQRP